MNDKNKIMIIFSYIYFVNKIYKKIELKMDYNQVL